MNITLSDHFGYRKLLRFTLPTIAMMIFTSIYSSRFYQSWSVCCLFFLPLGFLP